MGLFRISREWQFEVCICGEPSVSPQSARAREHFYRGEEEVGRALTESWLFIACILARKGEESFFFVLVLLWSQGVRTPPLVSQLCLIEISVY